jgi:hypothetical protein
MVGQASDERHWSYKDDHTLGWRELRIEVTTSAAMVLKRKTRKIKTWDQSLRYDSTTHSGVHLIVTFEWACRDTNGSWPDGNCSGGTHKYESGEIAEGETADMPAWGPSDTLTGDDDYYVRFRYKIETSAGKQGQIPEDGWYETGKFKCTYTSPPRCRMNWY